MVMVPIAAACDHVTGIISLSVSLGCTAQLLRLLFVPDNREGQLDQGFARLDSSQAVPTDGRGQQARLRRRRGDPASR